MNTYEGLYIITTQGQDENVPEIIEQLQSELRAHSCEVESVQRLERRKFERPSNKIESGYFINIRFKGPSTAITPLKSRLKFNPAVYRQFYIKRQVKALAA